MSSHKIPPSKTQSSTASSYASSDGLASSQFDLANSRMMTSQDGWTYETLIPELSYMVFMELNPTSNEENTENYIEHFPKLYVPFLNKHWLKWKLDEHGSFSSVSRDWAVKQTDCLQHNMHRV